MLAPNGMTAKVIKAGISSIAGASKYTGLSTPAGMISSFIRNLIPSAIGCKRPCGPTLFGPNLPCINADTRLSA